MGTMPGWYSKPYEFWLFDEMYSNAAEVKKMAVELVEPYGSMQPYWVGFWGGASPLGAAETHFSKHWLAALGMPEAFFQTVMRDEEKTIELFQKAFAKAARVAVGQPDKAKLTDKDANDVVLSAVKPLALVWVCTEAPAGQEFIGIGVADGPHTVVITITTPPYKLEDQNLEMDVSTVDDRAWTFKLEDQEETRRTVNASVTPSAGDPYEVVEGPPPIPSNS